MLLLTSKNPPVTGVEAAPLLTRAEVEQRVAASMWEPEHPPYRAATAARMEETLNL